MSKTDPAQADVDKVLASFDFARLNEQRESKHRAEMEQLVGGFLDVADLLQSLEEHCANLVAQGHHVVPHRSVRVVLGRLLQSLREANVQPMDAVGQPLNLDHHEVVEVRPDPRAAEGTVLEERRRGYFWKSRPLRRAQVTVARSTTPDAENSIRQEGKRT